MKSTITKTWRWLNDPQTPEESKLRITRRGTAADVARAARARPTWLVPRNEVQPDTLEMLAQDKRDLLGIADLVRAGEVKRAANVARRLDTSCRERLPRSFFLLLQKEGVRW